MDKLDFLSGDASPHADTPAPQALETTETTQAAPETPVRDDKGRFAAKSPAEPVEQPPAAPQPQAATPEATATPAPTPQGPTPEERYAALEAQVQGLQKALTASRQQVRQQRQAPPPPEWWSDDDIAHFNAEQTAWQQEADQKVWETTLHWSRQVAEARHGAEQVGAAFEWAHALCDRDPIFNQRIRASDDPFSLIMAEHQRDQALARLQDPAFMDRFNAFLAGQTPQPPASPAQGQPAPSAPALPPRSQASAPSAAGSKPAETPAAPGAAFGTVFGQ